MLMSATPWMRGRSTNSTESVRRALPATKPKFQPSPIRNIPSAMSGWLSGGVKAFSSAALMNVTALSRTTEARPIRSASQPVNGDSTYMPVTCPEITSPTNCRLCPCSCM
jgi:hypothetical protein